MPDAPTSIVPAPSSSAPTAPTSIVAALGSGGSIVLSGVTNPTALNGTYVPIDGDWNARPFYVLEGETAFTPENNPDDVPIVFWDGDWWNIYGPALSALFLSGSDVATPDLAEDWQADAMETGTPIFSPAGSGITPLPAPDAAIGAPSGSGPAAPAVVIAEVSNSVTAPGTIVSAPSGSPTSPNSIIAPADSSAPPAPNIIIP